MSDVQKVFVKATVKKISTTAAKGGTAIASFEIPIGQEAGVLLEEANQTCALMVSFSSDDISKAEGQTEFDFAGEIPDKEGN